jgi:hypothetical protein
MGTEQGMDGHKICFDRRSIGSSDGRWREGVTTAREPALPACDTLNDRRRRVVRRRLEHAVKGKNASGHRPCEVPYATIQPGVSGLMLDTDIPAAGRLF